MRTEKEFLKEILDFAKANAHIRGVGMEGSRVNQTVQKDAFQDFDITFFVDEMEMFTKDDAWLSTFGNIMMMQKPEDMELFPPEEDGFSYLILFDDYVKMDLTLLEKWNFTCYANADRLRTILLDKDGEFLDCRQPTDEEYWIKKPSSRSFDDCCNEFWFLTTYVVKGLCRQEFLFALEHMHRMRSELLRMISWQIGLEKGFCFSVGKNYKWIHRYISQSLWERVLRTCCQDSYEAMWKALFQCQTIFREVCRKCANSMGYSYPPYDGTISQYTMEMYRRYG